MTDYAGLLRSRNYRLWFTAAFNSGLGDWIGFFALQVLVASLTQPGSRLALFAQGGIMVARLLPSLLVGPVAGVLADRYNRKRLIVTTNLVRASIYAVIAFSQNLITLFTLVFVVECFTLLFLSARDASLPRIVRSDQLTQANQLNLLATYGTLPIGALVATGLVTITGALQGVGFPDVPGESLALLFNAGTFVVAGLLYARVDLPERRDTEAAPSGAAAAPASKDERPGIMDELREGLRFIRDLPLIRSLIVGVTGVFFGAGVVLSLGPEFVRTTLEARSQDYFILVAVVGVGLVSGIGAVSFVTAKARHEKVFPVTLAMTAVSAGVMGLMPSLWPGVVVGFFLGFFAGMSVVIGYTLLHAYTLDEVRGKTFASFYLTTRVALVTSLGLTPFVAGTIGTITIIVNADWVNRIPGIRLTIVTGALVALYAALVAGRGMYRAMREEPDRPARMPTLPGSEQVSGVLVAVEGPEGAGKSTQVTALCQALEAEGHKVVRTREPGGTPVAESIRGVVLDPANAGMHPRTEALLYAAARTEHVERVILPALTAGKIVVCDRFIDSSLAYQGFGRGLGAETVFEMNRWAIGGILPDVVVLLNIDPEVGMRRVADRAGSQAPRHDNVVGFDRMERESIDFHRRVADGFLSLARKNRSRFVVVDADTDPDGLARQIRSNLHAWIPLGERRAPSPGADRDDAAG